MINDPSKWEGQTWRIPQTFDPRIEREGEEWYISFLPGVRVPITKEFGERFVKVLILGQTEEDQ